MQRPYAAKTDYPAAFRLHSFPMQRHPITAESFAIIDQEVGDHSHSSEEYAVIRRAIHATADFELLDLFEFSEGAIAAGITALQHQEPVIVDVRMVQMGITGVLKSLGYERIPCALDYAPGQDAPLEPGTTRTAAGMMA